MLFHKSVYTPLNLHKIVRLSIPFKQLEIYLSLIFIPASLFSTKASFFITILRSIFINLSSLQVLFAFA